MSSQAKATLDELERLIEDCFRQTHDEYEREVTLATQRSGVQFASLRPVFVNGHPGDVEAGNYLLFVGLNPKLDNPENPNTEHYRKLNAGPADNASVTLGYFRNIRRLHRYFVRRARLARAFAETRGFDFPADNRDGLQRTCIFCESVPYHSSRTNRDLRPIHDLENVIRARAAINELVSHYPPAAIVLDGASTRGLVKANGDARTVQLKASTRVGRPKVLQFRHHGIPVVHCGFIGSQAGINSNAQIEELGALLARPA